MPSLSAHIWSSEAQEMGAPGPRSCFRPWRLIPAPDLMPGVDVQVLEAGCGLQLPHRGVDLILLEGHCVPCELHRAQLRLQALQLPGGGEKIGDCWGGRFRLAGRQGEERLGRRRQTERGPGERRGSKREKQPHSVGKRVTCGGRVGRKLEQHSKQERGTGVETLLSTRFWAHFCLDRPTLWPWSSPAHPWALVCLALKGARLGVAVLARWVIFVFTNSGR